MFVIRLYAAFLALLTAICTLAWFYGVSGLSEVLALVVGLLYIFMAASFSAMSFTLLSLGFKPKPVFENFSLINWFTKAVGMLLILISLGWIGAMIVFVLTLAYERVELSNILEKRVSELFDRLWFPNDKKPQNFDPSD